MRAKTLLGDVVLRLVLLRLLSLGGGRVVTVTSLVRFLRWLRLRGGTLGGATLSSTTASTTSSSSTLRRLSPLGFGVGLEVL